MSMDVATAYAECRAVAKREAKNFYFAFLALPKHKSDAMCAVYAFMRKADDISDDESFPIEQRRIQMETWLNAWRAARAGASTDDPVFVALNDTQRRFQIPDELLEQLVRGTTMDLEEQAAGVVEFTLATQEGPRGTFDVYEDFEALYRYCYLVASVVGLVCIRIFGYTDAQAETYAEEIGIAFQLTNILRDVREDAERNRIYLPLTDMQQVHLEVEQFVLATQSGEPSKEALSLLHHEIYRAREYYKSVDGLIPLLDKDSRGAMQVLAEIYQRLLEKIAAEPAAVFRMRVSVPTATKLAILAKGMLRTLVNRIA